MHLEDTLYSVRSLQERLPHRLRVGAGWTYRHLPRRVRLGPAYDRFRSLAEQSGSWSADDVAAYQVTQLRSVLTRAAARSPFYARRFAEAGFDPTGFGDLADLEGCPYVTKRDLADHVDEMAADDVPASRRLYVTTGGSTGSPVGFYLTKGISRPKEQAFLEAQWRRAGYVDGARLAVVRGQVTSARAGGAIAAYDAARDWLVLSSYHLTEARLGEYLEAIARFRPDILHIYPSAALLLVAHMRNAGAAFPVPLRCVLAASERLTDPQRRMLEEAFGCRVYSWYGHAERVVLAGQGRRSDAFYFWPTYGYVELGPPDDQGLQEVVGTGFHNPAMPLVRYRTGDYVRRHDPARDGAPELPWPAVRAIEGRGQELLVTATGRRISLTALNMHDTSFDGLYALQFFQDTAGRAELRYVAGPTFEPSRIPLIESAVRSKLGDDLEVVLRQVDDIEKTRHGKGRWLVSRLPQATADGAGPG